MSQVAPETCENVGASTKVVEQGSSSAAVVQVATGAQTGASPSAAPPGMNPALLQRQDSTGTNHEPDSHDTVRFFAPARDSLWIKLFRCCCCLHMPCEFYVVNRTRDWKLVLCVIHDPNFMMASKGEFSLAGTPTSGQISIASERTTGKETPVQVSGLGPAWTRAPPPGSKGQSAMVEAKRSITIHGDRAYLTVIAENVNDSSVRMLIFKHMCVLVGENVYVLPRHVNKDNLGQITQAQYEKLTAQWTGTSS